MNDRPPPHSPEAEAGSLGCIFLAENPKQLLSKLRKSDYHELRNKEVFTALSFLAAEGRKPDFASVHQWLKDKGRLEDAGGIDYLSNLPDATPSVAHFESWATTLKEKAWRRNALEISARVSELCYDERIEPRALVYDAKAAFDGAILQDADRREWFRFYSPSECRSYNPPDGLVLVGNCHITRGTVTVIAGPPGVGKSRGGHSLAVSGGTGNPWFGLPVHRRFKTAILQNENGLYRLRQEFTEIGSDGLDDFVRVSEPPPFGMAFDNPEFRDDLAKWLDEWKPDCVVFDPWNSAARDDNQRDYLGVFQALRSVLPKGDAAPAQIIIAHTRKPKGDERKTGRGLLNDVAGSHVLVSVPRCVFLMQHATDDPTDDRVVWTCSKNNDGQLGKRSAWHRRNGLFVPCEDFDWESFDAPEGDGRRTVTEQDIEKLFAGGKHLQLKYAAKTLEENTGLKHSACYSALSLSGRFSGHLKEDQDGSLYWTE